MLNNNGSKIDLPIGNEPTIVIPNPTAQRPSGSRSASTATPTGASTNFMEVSGSSSEGPTIVEYAPLHDSTFESSDVVRRAPIRTPLALQVPLKEMILNKGSIRSDCNKYITMRMHFIAVCVTAPTNSQYEAG